jgi:hypothetical protein
MATIKSLTGAGWLKDADDNFQSLADLAGLHVTKFTFDAEADDNTAETPVSNKTVAAHPMAVSIPDNAIVISGHVDVITAVTSDGSATVAIHLANANDLLTATALTGLTEGKQLPMAAVKTTPIKLAAEKAVTVTVGTAALTAGKFDGYIVWMEGA